MRKATLQPEVVGRPGSGPVSGLSLEPINRYQRHLLPTQHSASEAGEGGRSMAGPQKLGGLAMTRFGEMVLEMEVRADRPGLEPQTYRCLTVSYGVICLTSEPLFFLLFSGQAENYLVKFPVEIKGDKAKNLRGLCSKREKR